MYQTPGFLGLGLYLYGDVGKPRDALLEEIAAWVKESRGEVLRGSHVGEADDGHRTLWLSLHPAEEDLELKARGPRQLIASARTSGAGPGYHAFVCELLDAIAGRFAVRWQGVDPTGDTGDETGYFHARNREELERQMLGWIRAVTGSLPGPGVTGLAISMPVDAPLYEGEGTATALGPRDLEFWSRAAQDDALARQFFSWWEPGTGAGYLLGRALCHLWSDVRWRKPASPRDEQLHAEVLGLLERAFTLDPRRDYPFAEWAELAALNGRQLPEGASARGTPSIGYRRGAVVARPFPGVQVRIPGAFSERFDKRGNWSAWGDGRTVWVSLLTAKRPGPGAKLPEPPGEPVLDQIEEGGEPVQRLTGKRLLVSAEELRMLVVSILFVDPADAGWAKDTWASVQLHG